MMQPNKHNTEKTTSWASRNATTLTVVGVLVLAGAVLVSVFYTPGREGLRRSEEPDLFFTHENWDRYHSQESGFAIEFPDEPQQERNDERAPGLEYETITYFVEAPAEDLLVHYQMYPDDIDISDPAAILLGALEGTLSEVEGARLQESASTDVAGYPGLEFAAESRVEAVHIRGVHFLRNRQLFTLLYVSDDISEAVAERFFESFELRS